MKDAGLRECTSPCKDQITDRKDSKIKQSIAQFGTELELIAFKFIKRCLESIPCLIESGLQKIKFIISKKRRIRTQEPVNRASPEPKNLPEAFPDCLDPSKTKKIIGHYPHSLPHSST